MRELNSIMEFDHIIEVHDDGTITEPSDIWAPDLFNGELDSRDDGWTLLNGFSRQYGYSGPIMHPSEFIGGNIERYIRETPGLYVALVSYCDDEDSDSEDSELDIDGWAIATREVPS